MTTGLVISVTDELVAELEEAANNAKIARSGNPWFSSADCCWWTGNADEGDFMALSSPATILSLLAERAELKRDAGRYRWLRDKAMLSTETAPAILWVNDCCEPAMHQSGWQSALHGDKADYAIDAAMQSEAKP